MTLLAEAGRLTDSGEPCPASTQTPAVAPFLLCTDAGSGAELLMAMLRAGNVTVSGPLPAADEQAPGAATDLTAWLLGVLGTRPDGTAGVGAVLHWERFAPLIVKRNGRKLQAGPDRHREPWTTTFAPALPGLRYVHLLRRAGPPGGDPAASRMAHWHWIGFFTWARVSRLTVAYEDLVAEPERVADVVLGYLGVSRALTPAAPRPAGHPVRRQSRATRRRAARASVSIVVVSHNEGENLPLTISGIRATVPDAVEVVVVDDRSTDHSLALLDRDDARVVTTQERGGVVGARNAGARAATGDILIFADAHVDPAAGWLEPLVAALGGPSVACAAPVITEMNHRHTGGYGFTWNAPSMRMHWLRGPRTGVHEVPFACGCLMAFRRDDFESVGGFDAGLVRWGFEDAEIGLNLWRRGRATVVVPQAQVAHLFRPAGPYDVAGHLVIHNWLRVASTHLPAASLTKVIAAARQYALFPLAYAQLTDSDLWARRDDIAQHARHDGAWFLDRFRIDVLR